MKEQTERQQDEVRQGKHRMRLTRKKRVVISVILTFSALLALPVFAWLYMHRSIETITKVNMPNALLIGAGDAKPIQQLELSNIDVSGAQKTLYSVCTAQSRDWLIIFSWHILRILDFRMKFIRHL